MDVRKSEIATTLAQLEQARASGSAKPATQLGYTKIYAPIDGIVSVRVAKQGEVVAQGSPIVVVVDVDHLWVRADVEESYIDSVQFGQMLRVRLPSGDILEGQVFFKGVENDFATQRDVSRTKRDIKTFAIKVSLPNDGPPVVHRHDGDGAAASAGEEELVREAVSVRQVRAAQT